MASGDEKVTQSAFPHGALCILVHSESVLMDCLVYFLRTTGSCRDQSNTWGTQVTLHIISKSSESPLTAIHGPRWKLSGVRFALYSRMISCWFPTAALKKAYAVLSKLNTVLFPLDQAHASREPSLWNPCWFIRITSPVPLLVWRQKLFHQCPGTQETLTNTC